MHDDAQALTASALLRLFDQHEEERHELSVEEMVRSFKPPVEEVKLMMALSLLCQAGLVHSRKHTGFSKFSITQRGIEAVGRHFTLNDDRLGRTFIPRTVEFDVNTYLKGDAANIDWTRWGTILTALSILVAILLWWLN